MNKVWFKKSVIPALFFECFCAMANFEGKMLKNIGSVAIPEKMDILYILVQWIAFFVISLLLYAINDGLIFKNRSMSPERKEKEAEQKVTWFAARIQKTAAAWSSYSEKKKNCIIWLVMMGVDFISLLGVYPGFFVYDATTVHTMYYWNSYTTHHPLLHVLVLGGVVENVQRLTGSYNTGIFVYILLQMSFMLAAFTYMLSDIRRRNPNRPCHIFGFFWILLCPTVTMFVLCSTKDGIFATALVLLTVELRRLLTETFDSGREAKHMVGFVASATLMMLFRNNGVYANVLFLILYMIVVLACLLKDRLRKEVRQGKSLSENAHGKHDRNLSYSEKGKIRHNVSDRHLKPVFGHSVGGARMEVIHRPKKILQKKMCDVRQKGLLPENCTFMFVLHCRLFCI